METFDSLFVELDSIDRHLSRRKFLKIVVIAAAPLRLALDVGDREFLSKVAATLIPPEAFSPRADSWPSERAASFCRCCARQG